MHRFPHIIWVVIDTLRADHLSCYGYPRCTSPHLDDLAAESTLYTQAFSAAPWTVSSFPSLFTGLYPSQHRVCRRHPFLDGHYPTLSEVLQKVGYRTLCVTTNPWISNVTGHHRGYEHFVKVWQMWQSGADPANLHLQFKFDQDGRYFGRMWRYCWQKNPLKTWLNAAYGRWFYKRYDYGSRRANHLTEQLLREGQNDARPVFLHINYCEPHLKYQPPPPYGETFLEDGLTYAQGRHIPQDPWAYVTGQVELTEQDFAILTSLYDAEILYQDLRLAELVGYLKTLDLLDQALLIVTSDHGENLGDHGLMDHQYCLYDSLLHVPLLIRYPGVFPAGKRVESLVQTTDLFPTILNLLELEDEPESGSQGHDLRPDKLAQRPRSAVWSEYLDTEPDITTLEKLYPGCDMQRYDRSLKAIRTTEWKYIVGSDGRDELYQVISDPSETQNVRDVYPEITEALRPQLEQQCGPLEGGSVEEPEEEAEVDRETRKLLEDLGYL